MKSTLIHISACLMLALSLPLEAQQKNQPVTEQNAQYPDNFVISKQDFNSLFEMKAPAAVKLENRYLNGSTLEMNNLNGDMRFLRIKLSYFKNSFLLIQQNGGYSTQVFVMSNDKSVFYKGTIEENRVLMVKCSEDEIVSE